MPRIFVAVPLPSHIASGLARALPVHPALRAVAPELLHVTLAFVGQTPEQQVTGVTQAVEAAARVADPFRLWIGGLGRFPERGRPTVVWGALAGDTTALERLAADVRSELARRRVPFDAKPFRAHITLGRVRDAASDADGQAIAAAVAQARIDEDLGFEARHVRVVESVLSARGPRYSSRAEIGLGRVR